MLIAIDQTRNSNPFTERFARAVANGGHTVSTIDWQIRGMAAQDVLIFHWPSFFLGRVRRRDAWIKLGKLLLARWLGRCKIIWVAHNAAEHEGGPRDPIIATTFLSRLDGVIYLSNASRDVIGEARDIPPTAHQAVIPHGIYESETPAAPYVPPRHNDRGIRLLSFGLLRPYKGHEDLIESVRLCGDPALTVEIVGRRFDGAYADRIARQAADVPSIYLHASDERIPDDVLESHIDAADGVVLPHRSLLNSGVAIHALSRNRPILAPDRGSLAELREMVGEQWVTLYDGTLDADDLRLFQSRLREMDEARPDLAAMDWAAIERKLGEFLRNV